MNHPYSEDGLTAARQRVDAAQRELQLQEAADRLRGRQGLAYVSIGDGTGPFLAAFNGEPIGEVWTDSPGVLHEWRASSYASASAGAKGPYPTARAAAASLLTS